MYYGKISHVRARKVFLQDPAQWSQSEEDAVLFFQLQYQVLEQAHFSSDMSACMCLKTRN